MGPSMPVCRIITFTVTSVHIVAVVTSIHTVATVTLVYILMILLQ
jgi:hypothetical protein